jgi:hypothetical protein
MAHPMADFVTHPIADGGRPADRLAPDHLLPCDAIGAKRRAWRFMRGRERKASRLRRRSTRPRINLIELNRGRQGAPMGIDTLSARRTLVPARERRVIERQHVVLLRLDIEDVLQLLELVRHDLSLSNRPLRNWSRCTRRSPNRETRNGRWRLRRSLHG